MASALLENLSAASTLAASDLFYVKQAGARGLKATGTQLLALVGTAYVPLAGGTMTGALTIGSGTITASAPALNVTQTWNSGAVDFDAILVNVTRTASSASSYLLNLKKDGSSAFQVRHDGVVFFANGSAVYNQGGTGGAFNYNTGGEVAAATRFALPVVSPDVMFYRDAAATLALRNSTNAQTFRVYRSYTDGSNYSRLAATWNTSTALLMAEGAGTGTDGNVAFNDAALATGATLGYIMVPSAAGVSTGVPADIPTGQTPIVFDSTNKKIGAYTGGAWVWTAALS